MSRILLANATVYTVDPSNPWAESVVIEADRIVYVGDASGAAEHVDAATEVIDLSGRMVLPGFVSAHDHLVASNWTAFGVHLYDCQSREELLETIGEYASSNPDEEVILGIGWSTAAYGGQPTAEELDKVVPDRPAILLDFTIHDAWLNTKALEAGGVDASTPDPQPGTTYWVRDDDGAPTGTAVEFAWMPTYIKAGAWKPESMIPASMEKNFTAAVAAGMTTFLNPGLVTPGVTNTDAMFDDLETILSLLAEIDDRQGLDLRCFIQPIVKDPNTDPDEFARRAADFASRYDSDTLRAFGIKIHPEGNWSSMTSQQLAPYEPDGAGVGTAGVPPARLTDFVVAMNELGLDVVTHVDGSATVRGMIDAIEASEAAGHDRARNQLHHLFWTHPDDYQRIVDMGISVNVTPLFTCDWGQQAVLALELLGDQRVNEQFAVYPALARSGIRVSLSADIPSSPLEMIGPLYNIEIAMTLQDPENPNSRPFPPSQRGMKLEEAIAGVTIHPAWQLRMEDSIGSVEVGKYADLAILDQNLFEVAPREIGDVRVLGTMMGGRFTHRDGI